MKQKEVKIIGLSLDSQMGILSACKMQFDPKNRVIAIKGEVGSGKSTVHRAVRLGTEGCKIMQDKNLYGDISAEIKLLDGELPVYVGTKVKDGKASHVLYVRDDSGKIVKNPIIDGNKATPAKYLEQLKTELTWHLDELMSENATTQRNILLKLYAHELRKVGVVFDKKSKLYNGTILHKIEIAERERDYADMQRKSKGGIKEDLVAGGFDPDRPQTIPDAVNVAEIKSKIREFEKQITIKETEAKSGKDAKLAELKAKGSEILNKCVAYNLRLERQYRKQYEQYEHDRSVLVSVNNEKIDRLTECENALKILEKNGYEGKEVDAFIQNLPIPVDIDKIVIAPEKPVLIEIADNKVTETDQSKPYISDILEIRRKYKETFNSAECIVDVSAEQSEIEKLNEQLNNAEEINRIVDAVDSFHEWRAKNDAVQELKKEYISLLSQIETGVKGLKIVPENENIFLMYDGSYDPAYFNNPKKELRKLSSYSDTQKPMICMLVQEYLLSKKPKAMRYLFIDRVPIDNKTRDLIERMAEDLNLWIFLNVTGDFARAELKEGEILIENGNLFFE